MSVFWRPDASLDVSTDPAALPDQAISGGGIVSGALARCKNLRMDQMGKLVVRDGITKLNTTALGDSISKIVAQNGNRYVFSAAGIYRDGVTLETGLHSGPWSAVQYQPFNSTVETIYALNGADRRRVENNASREWGIASPPTKPQIAVGSLTGLTGDYNVKYTYVRKEGSTVVAESNPSAAASAAVTLSNQSLAVTVTAPADAQVTHIRLYRTLAGGAIYYYDQENAVSDLTFDTNTSDGAMGSEVAIDHDQPPLGRFVAGPAYNGILFIVFGNKLYFSKTKQPEYWPSTYFIEVSPPQFPGQCVIFYNGQPYYLTKHKIYYIQGTGAATFFPLPMESITGAAGPQAAVGVHGRGIFHVGNDGIYVWSGYDQNVTQTPFQNVFRGETAGGVPGVGDLSTSWLVQFRNRLYFGYASAADTYPKHCLVLNLDNGKWGYQTWGIEFRTAAVDPLRNQLLGGSATGNWYVLEDDSATTDDGTAIAWEAESKAFTLQTRAHFPRFVKYDVDASNASECTGTVLLDGASHQTHTITGNRRTRQRQVATGNGQKMSLRITGTGPATVYAVEAE